MNITDISQQASIELISKYWSKQQPTQIIYQTVLIGDCHGDLHQFISPLILNDVIKLSGKVKTIDSSIELYVPEYTVTNKNKTRIIYLGDLVNEWIHSRTIMYILHDLLITHDINNIEFILGNHDLSILGRYYLFKNNIINIPEDIPALWLTLRKELNNIPEIKIYNQTIEYNNSEIEGKEYLHRYLDSLFEYMFQLFKNKKSKLSTTLSIGGYMYIVSHCTWTQNAIKELFSVNNKKKGIRPGDRDTSQLLPLIDSPIVEVKSINTSNYEELSNLCNEMFYSKSRLYLTKNLITYSRNTESIFLNHIVGHIIGDEWRDLNINEGTSKYNTERSDKLIPMIINEKRILYLDFGASAGYDHDEISRPDYVYVNDNKLFVSNLPAFSFIIEDNRHVMLVMKSKTPHSNDKFIFTKSKW